MPNPFRSSSRSRMGSNVNTVQKQGGGVKKAGFPHTIGRDSWTTIAFQNTDVVHGHCAQLSCLMKTKMPLACVSRGVGSDPRMHYFKCNGLPK